MNLNNMLCFSVVTHVYGGAEEEEEEEEGLTRWTVGLLPGVIRKWRRLFMCPYECVCVQAILSQSENLLVS